MNRKWWVLFTACLLTVMLNFDATAVNLAIPVMAHQLHASLANMQWVINAFVLLSAMFQILGGRSGDLYGHRKVYVIGTIIFVISSMIAGLAVNEGMLILGRIAQGFALGIAYPMTMALILNVFPKEEHGTAIGIVMGAMGVSLAVGPTLGGVILHYLSWRGIFFVNLPVGILTIICTYLFCQRDQVNLNQEKLDLTGGFFLALGLLGIILPLNQSQSWGFDSLKFILTLIAGFLSFIILYYIEKNKDNRLVDFKLFQDSNFTINSLIRTIAQMVFIPVLFFTPIYMINILQFSPIHAGLIQLICTLFLALTSPIAGKLVDRLGFKIPNVLSMIFLSIGCFLFFSLDTSFHATLLFLALAFVGIGAGINFASTTSGALNHVKPEKSGVASGVLFTIVWASCALGVAIYGMIMNLFSKQFLDLKLTPLNLTLSNTQTHELIRASHGLSPTTHLQHFFSSSILPKVMQITQAAYIHGFRAGFMMLTGLSIFGIVLSLLTRKVAR